MDEAMEYKTTVTLKDLRPQAQSEFNRILTLATLRSNGTAKCIPSGGYSYNVVFPTYEEQEDWLSKVEPPTPDYVSLEVFNR